MDARPLDIEGIRDMDGLAIVRGMLTGALPNAPIAATIPFHAVSAERGHVVMEGTPVAAHGNPFGSVHGGWSATLMDSAMTLACLTTVPAGQTVTTLEFKLTFIRPVTAGGAVRVEARILNAGRRTATATAEMRDGAGKLLVHATSTCLVLALPGPESSPAGRV